MKNINVEMIKMVTNKAFILLFALAFPFVAIAAPLDLATKPLTTIATTPIQPNLLYIFDDSGSMTRDYMPDWANANNSFEMDASYNSIYYDPAITYLPPAYFTAGGQNTTTYPSQTGPWTNVKKDAYGVVSNSTTDLTALNGGAGPEFWVTIPSEFCKKADLKDCNTQASPDATYSKPAAIRWCNSANNADRTLTPNPAAGDCQGARVPPFDNLRAPETVTADKPTANVNFSNAGNGRRSRPRINGITVGGQQIMSGRTGSSSNENTLASDVANRINNCTYSAWGNCTVTGISAVAQGANVIIYGIPAFVGQSPSVAYDRTLTVTPTAFVAPATTIGGRIQTYIAPGNDYGYPGTDPKVKHGSRTDCAGVACTYAEEMTNYANWYTYYRTRSQMMKTSSSFAFEDIGTDFRVGFMTTRTTGSRSLDIKRFDAAHKANFYKKLFSTVADYWTPLRGSLATAGRIYANKTSAGGTFSDPVQHECQDNYTILTTDGVWNTQGDGSTDGPVDVDGNTIGNTDSAALGTPLGQREGTAVSSTLADVAMYYSKTDIRDDAFGNCIGALGDNICGATATGGSSTSSKKQNMITYTLGLGVNGTISYQSNYEDEAGDYLDILAGILNWPSPDASDNTDPSVAAEAAARIDDLWHAAVNGGGKYFSAKNPTDVKTQLKEALSEIKAEVGAGAALATSAVNLSEDTNDYSYLATFTSQVWTGNLERHVINADGTIESTPDKCVEDLVLEENCNAPGVLETDASGNRVCVTENTTQNLCTEPLVNGNQCRVILQPICQGVLDSQSVRNIYFKKGNAISLLGALTDLTTVQQENFQKDFLLSNLSQATSFNQTQKDSLDGQKLIDYILGDKSNEESIGEVNRLFRKRIAVLGDVVNSKPSYLAKSNFNYGDAGYQAFKKSTENRAATVYVGSNDGMLHAFDAETLEERWAYIPSAVIPNLWKLADTSYDAKHTYYVNGDFKLYDICTAANCTTASASDWKTVLIGGLDAGGRSYYALDVTNPNAPTLMWEIDPNTAGFDNLGYSYSEPIVTKRSGDKKWVVLFASGYNNIPDNDAFYDTSTFKPTQTAGLQFRKGDGKGYLYVVDAKTGANLTGSPIATGVGSISDPSGLGKITAYILSARLNNETTYVYGGDLLGNLWRFNIDSSANSVVHLAQLKDATGTFGTAQPITTRPELGKVKGKKIIYVGTGKFLEPSDVGTRTQQSLYAIKDTANDADAGIVVSNPRGIAGFKQQTISTSSDPEIRVATSTAVDLTRDLGWFVDLPDPGERQDVPSQLISGTLVVPTRVPTGSACEPSGYGWLNFLDYKTGSAVQIPGAIVSQRSNSPFEGISATVDKDGNTNIIGANADGGIVSGVRVPVFTNEPGFKVKRSIWRELIDSD